MVVENLTPHSIDQDNKTMATLKYFSPTNQNDNDREFSFSSLLCKPKQKGENDHKELDQFTNQNKKTTTIDTRSSTPPLPPPPFHNNKMMIGKNKKG
jgi:hypothetical protein